MTTDRTRAGAASIVPYLSVAVAAMAWGTWTLFLRPAHVDPRWSAVIALSAMTVFGTPLLLRAGARGALDGTVRGRSDWLWLGALGIGDAANAWFFFGALARTTVAIAILSHYLAPALVPLVAPTIARTPPRPSALRDAAIATGGLLLVLQPWHIAGLAPGDLAGAAFGATSAVFYASNVCVSKRLATRFTAEEQLVFHSAMSVAILALLAPWHELPSLSGVAWITLGGVIAGVTGAVLFVRGVARIPAEHAALLTFLEPITAVTIGALVYGEKLGPMAWVGAAVVVTTGIASTRRG